MLECLPQQSVLGLVCHRQVTIANPSDPSDVIEVTIDDYQDGTYVALFTPGMSGFYTVETAFPDGLHPASANFSAELTSATPSMFAIAGEGITGGVVGEVLEVVIQPAVLIDAELNAAADFAVELTLTAGTASLGARRLLQTTRLDVGPLDRLGRRVVLINQTVAGVYSLSILLREVRASQ